MIHGLDFIKIYKFVHSSANTASKLNLRYIIVLSFITHINLIHNSIIIESTITCINATGRLNVNSTELETAAASKLI